jgi:hypothetical protein
LQLGLFPQVEAVFEAKQMRDNLVYDYMKSGRGEVVLLDKGDIYSTITLQPNPTIIGNKNYNASGKYCCTENPVVVFGNNAFLVIDYEKGPLARTLHTRRLYKEIIKGLKYHNSHPYSGGKL